MSAQPSGNVGAKVAVGFARGVKASIQAARTRLHRSSLKFGSRRRSVEHINLARPSQRSTDQRSEASQTSARRLTNTAGDVAPHRQTLAAAVLG
eukprot:2816330-Rhodomonas_salina.7